MKESIRLRLFTVLCGIVVLFVLVSLSLNTLFLQKYYLKTKTDALEENFEMIQKMIDGDTENIANKLVGLEKLENEKGIQIVIANKKFENIYSSRNAPRRTGTDFVARPEAFVTERQITDNISKFSEVPVIEKWQDKRLNSWFLSLYGTKQVNDGTVYILMRTSIAAISDSALVANKFFMFTGVITLAVGAIAIFFISKRFTKPILEINEIAKHMSVMDFSRKIKVKSKDEFGQLGESINFLSTELEKSIIELKDANKKLQADIAEKDKIDKVRKEFISNVSHELKTPIAIILGYTEGLKVNISEEDKDYYCDVITDEAQRMSKLVFSLLDLSQLEAGAVNIEKTNFLMSELMEQCIERSFILFKEKDIKVETYCEDGIMVNADYERIEQMMTNYLTNAINHVDENKIISIKANRAGDTARISVFNSGKHIPEESLDKIWDSFYKVDKARTRAYGGTGVGLYIVKTIIEAHSNKYGVNNVDNGVEFWFELDLANHISITKASQN